MKIFPAIDIKDGKCVRLSQGKFDEVTVFNIDPAVVAKEWERAGASRIHVVDLDGARYGASYNKDTVARIIKSVDIPIQVGGGIRSLKDIEEKINLGAQRVILGTVAINSPDIVIEAVSRYKEKIIVGVDAKDGKVAVSGWEKVSDVDVLELCQDMKHIGITTVIYTDISKDGMMMGPNIATTKEIIDLTGLKVIASGGVSSLKDIERVANIDAYGIVIGKALYNGSLSLLEIINLYEGR